MKYFLFGIACVAGAELAQTILPALSSGVPALWPPAGILLGTLAMTEPRRWWRYVAIASMATVLSPEVVQDDLGQGLLLALAVAAEACAGAWLLRRTVEEPVTLNRVRHAFALYVVAAAAPMLTATIMSAAGAGGGWSAWFDWWLMDVLAIQLLAPIVIAWREEWLTTDRLFGSLRTLELSIALLGAAALTHAVFGEWLGEVIRVPAFLLPFLLWPAFRFGPAGCAASVLVISLIGMWHTGHGHGPLAPVAASPDGWLLRAQGAVAMVVVSLGLLASVVAERRLAAIERVRLVAELQSALAEIKTLRGLIPICAWCHKVRDDAGFWQGLESYLDAHTDATFSHSICPSCSEAQHEVIAEALKTSAGPGHA